MEEFFYSNNTHFSSNHFINVIDLKLYWMRLMMVTYYVYIYSYNVHTELYMNIQ